MVDSDPSGDSNRTARNLLLGLLGLQLNLFTEDVLVEVLRHCEEGVNDELLPRMVRDKSLDHKAAELLMVLLEKHISLNQGSIEKSLACLSSLDSLFPRLNALHLKSLDELLQKASLLRNVNATDLAPTYVPSGPSEPVHSSPTARSKSRFRIIRSHARGGLGEVFLARDGELNREVAIKEIQRRFADDTEGRQRFRHEAEVTGKLEHPGIVPVYGFGQYEDGRPYYAMRFIRGNSLRKAIEEFHEAYPGGPGRRLRDDGVVLELRKLLGRFVDICNAIDFAHSRGVLHRDLKPGNIVLGKYGETLVVDWGLAKSVGAQPGASTGLGVSRGAAQSASTVPGESSPESVDVDTLIGIGAADSISGPVGQSSQGGSTPTMVGTVLGTPAFMSPEQASGAIDSLGPATDVYGLGAILYQILSGRPPIAGASIEDVLARVKHADFSSPRAIRPDIPKPLESICLRAMSLLPADRYPSAAAVAEDVERWLADEPVSAYRETLAERFVRLLRKHRAWATAATFAMIGIAVASSVATFMIDASRRAAVAAQAEEASQRRTADQERVAAVTARTEEARQRALAERNAEEAMASSYLANIRFADLSLKHYRSGVAIKALDACLPAPGARDLREWEWHYLKSTTERSFRRLQTSGSRAIAFDSDSRRLVVDGGDVIDVLAEAIFRKLEPVNGATIVRNNICYGYVRQDSVDHIYAWNLDSGQVLLKFQEPVGGRGISSMVISPDGLCLAAGRFDGDIRRWSLPTGETQPPLTSENTTAAESIHCVAYSHDGTQLAAGDTGGKIRIWDTSTATLTHTLKIAVGEMFAGAPVRVTSVRFRPDGKSVFAGLTNGKLVEWDISNEKIAATWNYHTGVVTGIGALKANGQLLTTSSDQTIGFASPAGGDGRRLPASDNLLLSSAVSDDERWLATLDVAGEVRVWDIDRLATGNIVATGWDLLDCVAVSDDGQLVAWGGNDGFMISQSEDWVAARTFRRAKSGGAMVHRLQFSSSGHRLLSSGIFSQTHPVVWDTRTGAVIRRFPEHPGAIPTFLSDGRQLVMAEKSGLVVLDVDTGKEVSRFQSEGAAVGRPKESFLQSLGAARIYVSADERYAVTLDTPMARWDLRDGSVLLIENTVTAPAMCGAWSEDGKRFAVGYFNGVIQLWDQERFEVLGTGTGHRGLVTALAFNRDGSRLVSSGDTTIRIWDPSSMNELCTLEGHTQLIRDLCFSRDGYQIVSVGWDRSVRVWDGTPDRSIPRDHEMASAAIRYFRSQSTDSTEVQHLILKDQFLTGRARLMALAILSRPAPQATTLEVLSK